MIMYYECVSCFCSKFNFKLHKEKKGNCKHSKVIKLNYMICHSER